MSRERVLQRRLRTLRTLDEVVDAMRALSAQHFRAARARLASVRAYRDEVLRFLPLLARDGAAPRTGPSGLVLVAADLGMVGDYTARLVNEVIAFRKEHGGGPVVCLGERALALLARAGIEPAVAGPAPASVGSLAPTLLRLVDDLLGLHAKGAFGPLWLVAARFEGAGHYAPVRIPLLPAPISGDGGSLPASPYADSGHLREVVKREYLYVALYEGLLEALSSEHGKRLVTAEAARHWLAEKIDSTQRRLASQRRESSTQEVLEVARAARAAGLPS